MMGFCAPPLMMLRRLALAGFLFAIMAVTGCQTTIRNMSIWTYPAVAFPARSVETGGGNQVLVPAYQPDGNSFCVGMRFVHINAESKNEFSTSNPIEWPAILENKMAR